MIRRLEVKGLNDRIQADLKFNEDLNIITGRNGSGKTTLLKLMWYLISGNLERILPEIPFDFVSIVTDLFTLTITRLDSSKVEFVSEKNTFSKSVDFTVPVNPETGNLGDHDYTEKLHELNVDISNELNVDISNAVKSSLFFPTFRRIEGGFSTLSRRGVDSGGYYRYHQATETLQDAISGLSTSVSVEDHKFIASISTHDIVRLLAQKYADVSEKINELQAELSQEIKQKIEDYFGNETEMETRGAHDATPVLEDIRENVLLRDQEREDLLKPFSVLAGLTQEILKYKEIGVVEQFTLSERIEGVTIGKGTEGITLGVTNEAIASEKLSAGEKQMLSFLCYNAFRDNTTIFIDEPELSLHVDWQRLLLPTLLDQSTGNQFFIATHSPFIFSRYQHKEILLGDDRGDKGGEI